MTRPARNPPAESAAPPGPLRTINAMNRRIALQTLSGAALWWVSGRPGSAWARATRIKPDATSALIVVDVQNCFIAGGTLAVPHGEDVVPVINKIAAAFQNVILIQDWHPPGY
jgi:nicotinamidase/pyrazinamidase